MGRNIKWVHAPSNEAASHWLPDGYSLPARLGAHRASFAIGESLTLYEAARIISGRHPYPLSPDGVTTLGPRIELISAGSTGKTRRRHRPLRGKAAFEALRQKVESGEIIPAEMCRLVQPGTIYDGGIDWLNVKVATADVARLCLEKGWRPKAMRLPIKELEEEPRENSLPVAEPLAIGAPAGEEAPDDIEDECNAWLAGLPKRPRLTREKARKNFNKGKAKSEIIRERPFLRAWKKSAHSSWHTRGRLPGT